MRRIMVLGLAWVLVGGGLAASVAAKDGAATASAARSVWTCPMHPQVKTQEAGACPICGMNLVKKAAPAPVAAGPLAPYFEIRRALAADDFGEATGHAQRLAMAAKMAAKSQKPAVAKALGALAQTAHALGALGEKAGAKAVRTAFGEVSKAALAYAKATKVAGALKAPVHVFHCPMAKPYGTWLQADAEIGNPYYGKKMLRCGSEVESLGASGGTSDAPKGKAGSSCCGG